jgi:LuxR family maltose regulon positive regulatory protein
LPGEATKGKTNLVDQETLSDRELEVLGILAAGQTYKEIGRGLFLSLNTVEFHIKSIYRKLSVNRRVEAVAKARGMNLI